MATTGYSPAFPIKYNGPVPANVSVPYFGAVSPVVALEGKWYEPIRDQWVLFTPNKVCELRIKDVTVE